MKNQVEALLFSCGKAMEEEQLAALIGTNQKVVKAALKALQKEYEARETALKLFVEGSSWKLLVHDEYIPLVRRIIVDTELSKATMETLAVIAYHQPNVLQSKVVELRGGNAYEQIAELETLGFVVKKKQGRSFALRLTEKFYDYFDVEGEHAIRKVFTQVKASQPKEAQRKLGDLDVVDPLPKGKKRKEVLGFEVVEPLPDPPHRPNPEEGLPDFSTAKMERDPAAENEFLSRIERQIEELSRRNDEVTKDGSFRPSASPDAPVIPPEEDAEKGERTEKKKTI